MPTDFWYPIASATHNLPYDAWTNAGGANKNASVLPGGGRAGPMTHDDDTSYVAATSSAIDQAVNIDWPAPMLTYDGFLSAGWRQRNVGDGGAIRRVLQFSNAGGTLGGTPAIDITDSNTSYVTTSPVDISVGATYRPGGGAWVLADFADDKTMFPVSIWASGGGGGTIRVTSVFGQITYTPPSGGFAFLLGIAGLLPVLGSLVDRAHFMRYLSWRRRFHPRHTILTGPEVEQAWREIRAYRHPRFFLPAVV